jgi:prephenate dehydratase
MRLGYLGPAGTFTETAAQNYDASSERVAFLSNASIVDGLKGSIIDYGVLAIENSLNGSVPDTLDLLIHELGLQIVNELVIPIEQCLMARHGAEISDIVSVYSHPNALGQCRIFLRNNLPNAEIIASMSTISAVQQIDKSERCVGAIAPRRASEIYDVSILASSIQDEANNETRFVVIGASDSPKTGIDKTSICFSFSEDRPGLLYSAMREFSQRNINLLKVESRPTKEILGRYIFLVDLSGHRSDRNVSEAFDLIRKQTNTFKILGSYPVFSK